MSILERFDRNLKHRQSSYKMVVLLALLETCDIDGAANINAVTEHFKNFYEVRQKNGKLPEKPDRLMRNVENMSFDQARSLILKEPLRAMEEFLEYDSNQKSLCFKEGTWMEFDRETLRELRRLTFRHLYDYFSDIGSPQLTIQDLDSLALDFGVKADDIASLSGHNRVKGIHPLERDGKEAVIILCTIGGKHYPNLWLDEGKSLLKYYAEGRTGPDGSKAYNLNSKSNKAVIDSREKGLPLHVFVREQQGGLFHYAGIFQFNRKVEEESGDVYFELQRVNRGETEANVPVLPDVTREVILDALERFDRDYRESQEWVGWENRKTQRYALQHEERRYPPKFIIELATGVSRRSFSGGNQANTYLEKRGFRIVSLNNTEEAPEEVIKTIESYISSRGFIYDEGFVRNLFLCLKTKPFVILAGITGTGKSKLGELFAAALGATTKNGRFSLIPVRPDWNDSTDLLGYQNLQGDFVEGPLTQVILRALENPDSPYFVLLDEMNLARVEYYFSDFLSVIESRQWEADHLTSAPIPVHGLDKHLYYPENLYILGTVNMDETTHPFSRKVLDRANTIEFSSVWLGAFPKTNSEKVVPLEITNSLLKNEFITLQDCLEKHEGYIREIVELLEELNNILKSCGLHVGYRVRDEVCFYMVYNKEYGLLPQDKALDYQIKQKILPRIQGSSFEIEEVLTKLHEHCSQRFTMSQEKIEFMRWRFSADGFTSFWL